VSQFAPEDSQGSIDLVSNGDITFEADRDQDGAGDLVFRTGGVERARIKHDGSGTGWPNVLGGSVPDVVLPAPSGIAAVDTTNWQDALVDVPDGGWIHIPHNANPWLINATLTIGKNCYIEGVGAFDVWGTTNLTIPTSLSGSVVKQVTAATDVFTVASGVSPRIRGLGVTFDSPFYFNNTGHGFNFDVGASNRVGAMGARLDDVSVLGQDGNHYGFRFRNCANGTYSHCRAWGGGGFALICDLTLGNLGNSVFIHPQVVVIAGGSADGYYLSSSGGGPGLLNLMAFIRPQAILTNTAPFNPATPVANTQKPWHVADAFTRRYSVIAPDFESTVSGTSSVLTGGGGPFWIDPAGTTDDNSAFGVSIAQSEHNNRHFYNDLTIGGYSGAAPSSLVNEAALGTSPPTITTDGTSDDWRGIIRFGSGTSPTTGQAVEVLYSQNRGTAPYVVVQPLNAATAALGLYVSTTSAAGFIVSVTNAPTASQGGTTYQFAYHVVR
jgi:hypothetical protein